MNKYYVYAIINPKTDKPFYIGKGTGNRYRQHLSDKEAYSVNKRLTGKIRLIREETGNDPEIHILHDNLEESTAYEIEEKLILEYGRKGYEDHGILMNHLESGRPPSYSGENNPFYGKTHSEETRKKMSEAKKDFVPWNKGQAMLDETKEKLRERASERVEENRQHAKNMHEFNRGKKHSQEWKDKISKGNASRWLITYPNGRTEEILSINAWGKANGVSHANLIKHGHSKGYKAMKLE